MKRDKEKDINYLDCINFQDVKFDGKTGILTIDGNPINNIVKLEINKLPNSRYTSVSITFDANFEVEGISDSMGKVNYNSKKDSEFSLKRNIGECKAKIKYKGKKGNLLFFK